MEYKVFCLFAIALIVGSFSSANGQAALTQAQCAVARINCGESGITQKECNAKGCCFDSHTPDADWCFYSKHQDGKCHPRSVFMNRLMCLSFANLNPLIQHLLFHYGSLRV
uniref:P-type domain-containing protein n=1 Tax=Leptobrachium leishanense TaxID=445787 RepID=A0A8C5LRR3_9ANUR